VIDAAFFACDAVEVAPALLGAILSRESAEGRVAVRLTEVEAYRGVGEDPGSHAFRGKRARNATMFGPPAHLYAYFTYGMHTCANIVCGPEGTSAGVLRAGAGPARAPRARRRRGAAVRDRDLARGPARLAVALGIPLSDDGAALDAAPYGLVLPDAPLGLPASGPRVGVSGPGGSGELFPWRFWVPGDPTVSPYRAHVARVRR
jgi:DNA-3-methyladenine glycosylase